MSLSGVFEIGMSMTGVGAKLTQSGGLSSSFFLGVLATVVATPCMAPFLGVAVGAALTMEWLPALRYLPLWHSDFLLRTAFIDIPEVDE